MADHNGRIALDIETISPNLKPTERPDFEDSNDFEILVVALGYEPTPGTIEELTALCREDLSPESELNLVSEALDWIDARQADRLVTYNGTRFDLKHLEGRPSLVEGKEGNIAKAVRDYVQNINHLDLKPAAWRRYGNYTTLEELCRFQGVPVVETPYADYDHGFDLGEICNRGLSNDPIMDSRDVPAIGERWLDGMREKANGEINFEETKKMLQHYALADIKPLFQLADNHPFED